MEICKNSAELSAWLEEFGQEKSLGFVPTMGALHKGHISLTEQSVEDNDLTVVSIYVNPTQFNDPNDLRNYPRDMDGDIKKLSETGCDMLFIPDDSLMYQDGDELLDIDIRDFESSMEGKFRPGHLRGVVTVVDKFFDLLQPDAAYFGEKDYQQLALVRYLAEERHPNTDIIGCRTVREYDGLAMSSRNLLLSDEEREAAALIYKTLEGCVLRKGKMNKDALAAWIRKTLTQNPLLKVEYICIIDPYTIEELEDVDEFSEARICVAVYCGKVRLIDNIEF